MSKNTKAVRTVATVCQCGKTFQREIRRGRPQIWCDACMTIPFAKRITAPVVTEAKVHTDAEGVERIANQWDDKDAIRPQIEANVAEVNMTWPVTRARMIKAGYDAFAIGDALRIALTEAYKAAGA